jgi:hypothetical protein
MKYITIIMLALAAVSCNGQTAIIKPGFTIGDWVVSGEFFTNKKPVGKVELFSNGHRYVIQYVEEQNAFFELLEATKWLKVMKEPGFCQTNDFTKRKCAEEKAQYEARLKNHRIVIWKSPSDSIYTKIRVEKIK